MTYAVVLLSCCIMILCSGHQYRHGQYFQPRLAPIRSCRRLSVSPLAYRFWRSLLNLSWATMPAQDCFAGNSK
ncbi:hypothetical protein BKA59DRAFT_469988 [Fusarium tricinctum]|uniref:Secreted protein n=1 Tax=Fusarium tricinctum TaxID=61284 RepID=A0A8K0WG34_9HYPO|nr:hypothetical protein BKA59DRAFT_469988 [Fusarium tricinctum]